jgi:chromosomal replication initiator protein
VRDPEQLWKTCATLLQAQISEATWKAWFDELRPISVEDGTLLLGAPSTLVRDRLEGRYLALVRDALAEVAGEPMSLHLEVDAPQAGDPYLEGSGLEPLVFGGAPEEGLAPLPPEHQVGYQGGGSAVEQGQKEDDAVLARALSGGSSRPGIPVSALNPRYTFDAFVIGASNRFAHAAALRVAETPASSYNPLFIHGDSGLGKTHLLHAIGHYVRENFAPTYHVRYVSTETFMNEFVDAIRTSTTTAFKRRYRACDVLLVDDIQFMENKEALQEEFFHTFNSLYEATRQIVISSDRHPRSIATLEDRLRSRFEWGLITDVQPPELETRLAILRKKAEGERAFVPDEVLELIATHVKDNIRELEGALIRVSAFASLNRQPLTRELAEEVLSDILAADEPRQITPKLILDATAEAFGYSLDDICGTSRRRPLVTARQIGMYLFRELTDFSYPAIAREFGGRDHTTVIHAVEKVSGLMKERRQIYDQVTALIYKIKSGA